MKRKLIRQGAGGQTISLPLDWVRKNDLDSGDEIDMYAFGDGLLIYPEKSVGSTHITIDSEDDFFVRQVLRCYFSLGYSIVHVHCVSPEHARMVGGIATSIGLSTKIHLDGTKKLTINIDRVQVEEKQSVLVQKMIQIVRLSFETVVSEIQSLHNTSADELQQHTNRFDAFCNARRRAIIQNLTLNPQDFLYLLIYQQLLYIQHSLLHMHKKVFELNVPVSKSTQETLTQVQAYFSHVSRVLMKKDPAIASASKTQIDLYDTCIGQLTSAKGADTLVLHYTAQIARLINLLRAPITGVAAITTPPSYEPV